MNDAAMAKAITKIEVVRKCLALNTRLILLVKGL
jgi:hypothetical protein